MELSDPSSTGRAPAARPIPGFATKPGRGTSHRRLGLSGALAGAALLGACAAPAPRADNVVLVTIDTLRVDHLGCYGYPRPTSPFLDSIAERGLVFRRALSASSHTAPSHATLLTALYPEQHGVLVNGFTLPESLWSFASLARSRGAEPAGFVSVSFLEGLGGGFAVWDSQVPEGNLFRTADLTVDSVADWLEGRESRRPFFLWVHFYDVHEHKAETAIPPGPLERMRRHTDAGADDFLSFLREQRGYTGARVTRNFDRYDAQIAFVDSQLRRLYELVGGHAGKAETLWIVTADHGEGMGDHEYGGHGRHLYEEQLHVPLVVHSSSDLIETGSVTSLVRHVDVLPTLAELVAAAPPQGEGGIEGHSLVPWLDGSGGTEPRLAFAQRRPPDERRLNRGWLPGRVIAVRGERYKYISRTHGPDEFYDLLLDPHEAVNLAGRESEHERRLREWLIRKHDDLREDRRVEEEQAIPEEMIESLRALGYL